MRDVKNIQEDYDKNTRQGSFVRPGNTDRMPELCWTEGSAVDHTVRPFPNLLSQIELKLPLFRDFPEVGLHPPRETI